MSKSITPINTATGHFQDVYTAVNTVIQVLANEIVTANSAAGGGALTTGTGFVAGQFGSNVISCSVLQGGNTVAVTTANLGSNLEISTFYITGQGVMSLNSAMISIGNAVINTTAARYGNSTISTIVSNSTLTITGSGISVVANQSGFFPGANMQITTSALLIGNVTTNTFVNSSIVEINGGTTLMNSSAFAVGSNVIMQGNTTLPSNFSATLLGATTQNVDTFAAATFRTAEYTLSVTDNLANNYQASKVLVIQSGANVFSTEYAIVISNSAMGSFTTSVTLGTVALQFTPVSANVTVKGVKVLVNV